MEGRYLKQGQKPEARVDDFLLVEGGGEAQDTKLTRLGKLKPKSHKVLPQGCRNGTVWGQDRRGQVDC